MVYPIICGVSTIQAMIRPIVWSLICRNAFKNNCQHMLKLTTAAYIVTVDCSNSTNIILGLLPCQHQTHSTHVHATFASMNRAFLGYFQVAITSQFQPIIRPDPGASGAHRGQQKSRKEERLPGNDIAHKRQHGLACSHLQRNHNLDICTSLWLLELSKINHTCIFINK